jgi:hypothetical protein
MELQGAEHPLTPSRGRLNFKKMSLQTSTWRLSSLMAPNYLMAPKSPRAPKYPKCQS